MYGLVKVGYSSKDPDTRAQDLYKQNTGMPAEYEVQYKCLVENALEVEAKVHEILDEFREIADKSKAGNEWFRCSTLMAYQAIQRVGIHILYDEMSNDLAIELNKLKNQNKANSNHNWLLELENRTVKSGGSLVFLHNPPIATLREIEEAKKHLEGAVKHEPESQYQLALLYLRGSQPIRNKKKAVEWLIKSALNSYKPAKAVILRQPILFEELVKHPFYQIFSSKCLNKEEKALIQKKYQEQIKK